MDIWNVLLIKDLCFHNLSCFLNFDFSYNE